MKASQGRIGLAMLAALVLLPCIVCGGDSHPAQQAVNVLLSASSAEIDQGATLQFTASVLGTTNKSVTWSIQEGTSGGSITQSGLYTAPNTSGTFHVVATSAQDNSRTAAATVSVHDVYIVITPYSGDMEPEETLEFSAQVTGTVNHSVEWSIYEGSAGGSITSAGLYTAPTSTGTYRIIATSASNRSASTSVSVRVTPVAVMITPAAVGLKPGGNHQFSATVQGTSSDAVVWTIQEGQSGGTITPEGIYTAPTNLGDYHIIATSVSHPTVFASALASVVASNFTPTGEASLARSHHTATLLANGEVLITGGETVFKIDFGDLIWAVVPFTEVYNPSSGTFRATASLNAARAYHTATVLKDGSVLITGGLDKDWTSLSSAEIYDPKTGAFSSLPNMRAYRWLHTATQLLDGTVLIVGGLPSEGDPFNVQENAELFDPQTRTFLATGQMPENIWGHTATLLQDGRVLIAGDTFLDESPSPAQLYDPNTGTFQALATLDIRRFGHTATLLSNNRILFAGGNIYAPTIFDPWISDDAKIANLTTNELSSFIGMNAVRVEHTATLLSDGTVLLAGGLDGDGSSLTSSAEIFNPNTMKFQITGEMTKARANHTATTLQDGRVLIVGGSYDKSAEIYTPKP